MDALTVTVGGLPCTDLVMTTAQVYLSCGIKSSIDCRPNLNVWLTKVAAPPSDHRELHDWRPGV